MAGRNAFVTVRRNLSLVLLILLAALLRSNAAEAEKRVALVIGNAAYANAPRLANPLNDAKAVADRLKGLGFEVHLALDATQEQTLKALDEFAAALPGAEAALLYYSGHGLQLGGANYLLPVDIEVSSERSVRYGAIDISEVVRDMEQDADVSLVVLDACRDNPFLKQLAQSAGGTRSVAASRGLAPIKPTGSGTIIAYSAAAGAVASDGTADHSPYTAAFLDHVGEPNVEVGLMFRRVAGKVVDATGGEQRPEVLISLTREYYMNPEAPKPAALPVAARDQPPSKPIAPAENAASVGVAPAGEAPSVGPPAPVTGPPAAVTAAETKAPIPDDAAKAGERETARCRRVRPFLMPRRLPASISPSPSISRRHRGVRPSDVPSLNPSRATARAAPAPSRSTTSSSCRSSRSATATGSISMSALPAC